MSGLPPFMTTPELRQGPPPPYTNPSLLTNLVMRVFFGSLSILCSWVPMRLLWKNGEFSAAVYCITVMILNLFNVVNALIWRDDNVLTWSTGYGWCDLQVYTVFALETLYAACIFAIMRNLANKVGMMRATSLTASEKRRRTLREACVIFPFPLLQVIMTYFVLAQRYNVSTLVGCTNSYYRTWPYVVVYHVPTNVFAILTFAYGVLTSFRFRQVEKATSTARGNTTSGMHARHQRIRRKLYLMCISIMVPFFPMQMFWLYVNIAGGLRNLKPYDFDVIHDPATFNLVTFRTSPAMSFVEMNGNYVCVITAVPLFWFFGFTKEAVNIYRVYCLNLGLGRLWPKLHEEYDPDRTKTGNTLRSWGQNISGFLRSAGGRSGSGRSGSADNSNSSRKNSVLPSFQHVSQTATSTSSRSSGNNDIIREHVIASPAKAADCNGPWQDITVPEPAARSSGDHHGDGGGATRTTAHRNPFLFRTMLDMPHRLFARHHHQDDDSSPQQQQQHMHLHDLGNLQRPASHSRHPHSGSDTKSLVGGGGGGGGCCCCPPPRGDGIESRDSAASSSNFPPWAAVDSSSGITTSPSQAGQQQQQHRRGSAKVQTRVWSADDNNNDRRRHHNHHHYTTAGTTTTTTKTAEPQEDRTPVLGNGAVSPEIGPAACSVGDPPALGVRVETSIARSETKL